MSRLAGGPEAMTPRIRTLWRGQENSKRSPRRQCSMWATRPARSQQATTRPMAGRRMRASSSSTQTSEPASARTYRDGSPETVASAAASTCCPIRRSHRAPSSLAVVGCHSGRRRTRLSRAPTTWRRFQRLSNAQASRPSQRSTRHTCTCAGQAWRRPPRLRGRASPGLAIFAVYGFGESPGGRRQLCESTGHRCDIRSCDRAIEGSDRRVEPLP